MPTRRQDAAPIIKEVIARVGAESPGLKKALREAYPYGERANWPYKVWLDEIKVQLGLKESKIKVDPNQMDLFGI